MEFPNVDPIALGALIFAVVGVVELVKRLFDRDFRAAVIIAVAGAAGAILAPYAGGDISWFNGLLIGLSASGLVTAASRIGK